MKDSECKKVFKLVWSDLFGPVTGYRKWIVQVKSLHLSYQFLVVFFLLQPKLLPQRVILPLRALFFKHQGMQLIQQIELYLPPRTYPTLIRVYNTKELLDHCLEIRELKLAESVSNVRVAEIIDALFDTGLKVESIINYLSRIRR